jgi:hypothetical protein
MASSHPARPAVQSKPLPPAKVEAELLRPPVYPCELLPKGAPGEVLLNGKVYSVSPVVHQDRDGRRVVAGWSFLRLGVWHVAEDFSCDCPDCTFRDRQCKHAGAVKQLGLALGHAYDDEAVDLGATPDASDEDSGIDFTEARPTH